MRYTRRKFLQSGSTLAAGTAAISVLPKELLGMHNRQVAPSDQVRIAAVGIHGQGWADLHSLMKLPEVRVTTLCDVDENVLSGRAAELSAAGIKVKTCTDYRKLLEDKSIDAVLIATPDHWHCLIMTEACEAGKDVYCEKPLGRTIAECRVMEKAQQQYHRVVQIGQWQRSQKHFADAVRFVQSGKLGRIRLVKAWAYQGWMKSIPIRPDSAAPPGVHYGLWLGPSPTRAFNPNRFHFNFRWFYDYAGGLMTDWGVHLIDYVLLGMNVDFASAASAAGGKLGYPDDAEQWPDTMATLYDFPHFKLIWEQAVGINGGPYGRDHGIAYIGNNGTLVLDRGGWEVIPEGKQMEGIPHQPSTDNGMDLHAANFISVVKSRRMEDLHAPVRAGGLVAMNCHMGNIAHLTRETVHWNAEHTQFTDPQSNRLITPDYHNHYQLPKF
ncbi:MAG TPA: Gfo/Idh/MocA family oxidoreductase [Chitinophagaceae bacterium]|nr:Gfo/Idh/MocA family oxidoreductase [Chitinophagaceae bacterium]